MSKLQIRTSRRTARVRRSLKAVSNGKARLSVFRSSKHIYAQVIDDLNGKTLASASSMEKTLREGSKSGANVDAAKAIANSSPNAPSIRA